MKILQIGGTLVGAQREIELGIHEHLTSLGHESYILYAIGESNDANVIRYENKAENVIRRILRKFVGKFSINARLGTLNVIRYIKKIKPDVIHLHILHHGYIDYLVLFKYLAKAKIPVVYTMHDFWAVTGGCYHYISLNCDKFRTDCKNCPATASKLDCVKTKTAKELLRKLSLYKKLKSLSLVAVSPWVSSELNRSHLEGYPIYTVYNSIQWNQAFCLSKGFDKNKKFTILGVAANWNEKKGIHRFFELAKLLGDGFEILLVGNADADRVKGAPSNIKFLNAIKDKGELYRLYAVADIHVSMSLEETFGLTFVEAAFMGTKSMGFNSSAIPGVLEKTFGFIIDSLGVDDVAKKIKELSLNRENCKLNDCQINEIKEFFSAERMASEYVDIYKKVLSDS